MQGNQAARIAGDPPRARAVPRSRPPGAGFSHTCRQAAIRQFRCPLAAGPPKRTPVLMSSTTHAVDKPPNPRGQPPPHTWTTRPDRWTNGREPWKQETTTCSVAPSNRTTRCCGFTLTSVSRGRIVRGSLQRSNWPSLAPVPRPGYGPPNQRPLADQGARGRAAAANRAPHSRRPWQGETRIARRVVGGKGGRGQWLEPQARHFRQPPPAEQQQERPHRRRRSRSR